MPTAESRLNRKGGLTKTASAHTATASSTDRSILPHGMQPHFFFSSRRRHTRLTCDWSSDVCSSDLLVAAAEARPFDERLIFVNAWNEWAEGNALEPDLDGGHAKLEAVRRVVTRGAVGARSEERRVGKEWRGGGARVG